MKREMKRLTTQQLADMRNRANKTVGTEWVRDGFAISSDFEEDVCYDVASIADGEFIAKSKTDIPALLTEVDSLILEKAAARRKLDATSGILIECQRTGVQTIGVETVLQLIDAVRGELEDYGE